MASRSKSGRVAAVVVGFLVISVLGGCTIERPQITVEDVEGTWSFGGDGSVTFDGSAITVDNLAISLLDEERAREGFSAKGTWRLTESFNVRYTFTEWDDSPYEVSEPGQTYESYISPATVDGETKLEIFDADSDVSYYLTKVD